MAVNKPAQAPVPLAGMYDFVKMHLVVVNNLIGISTALVGVLDFFAPKLKMIPTIIYSATGATAALMLIAWIAPTVVERTFSTLGKVASFDGAVPVWRRSSWHFATTLLLVVSMAGFASIAKADKGGIIASNFPAARNLQESLLSLNQGISQVQTSVDEANGKLDRILETVGPDSMGREKERVAALDNSYLSLGYVSLAPDLVSKSRVDNRGRITIGVFPYNQNAKYADIKLIIRGMHIDGSPDGNVSTLFDRDVVGAPESITVDIARPFGQIVSCLTIPHPRLRQPYRVTQTFKARYGEGDSKDQLLEFYSIGPELVSIDKGEPCGSQRG